MIGQKKSQSLLESLCNVFSGMLIAFLLSQAAHEFQSQIKEYIWRGFTWELSAGSNAIMTIILTLVSVIRGYIWRRTFNKKLVKNIKYGRINRDY